MKLLNTLFFEYRILACFLIAIVYSGIVHTEESKKNLKTDQTADSKNKISKSRKKTNHRNQPATFIPSEKINADSAVSFPVDI